MFRGTTWSHNGRLFPFKCRINKSNHFLRSFAFGNKHSIALANFSSCRCQVFVWESSPVTVYLSLGAHAVAAETALGWDLCVFCYIDRHYHLARHSIY